MPSNNKRNSRDDKSRSARSGFSKNPAKNNNRGSSSGTNWRSEREGAPHKKDREFGAPEGNNPRGAGKFAKEGSFSKEKKFSKEGKFTKEGGFSKAKDGAFPKKGKFRPEGRFSKDDKPKRYEAPRVDDGLIRLNRYIANAGICSRRKADELIEAGVVSINGTVVTTLGTKVDPAKDEVRYNNERIKREKMVYVLLNKPKDFITTTEDPQERRTVMDLVSKASRERIYPVGRLDRNTTGLLLMTNDGYLAEKLSHPRNRISKLYYVELNKNLTQGDFNKIAFGLELEDGLIKPDDVSYVQGASKREVGIKIHSGKNRIVRRVFEHLGYDVIKLDRVVYADLTKKDLPRGHWRYLEEKEIIQLKRMIK